MKLGFLPADSQGRHDGVMHDRLWVHMPQFSHGGEPDATIVPISYFSDFKFNEQLRSLAGKKFVVADTFENYLQWPEFKTHLFGVSETPAFGGNEEWQKLSNFLRENPPALYFCRELFADCTQANVAPIEWPVPAELPAWQLEDKHNFDARPLEVFFQYGVSSCYRPMLHGDILKNSCKNGYEVINSLDHIEAKIGAPIKQWAAVHQPHTHRVPIAEVARRQAQSKITVSLGGAGVCCFRSTEAPVHSIPAIHSPNKVWSFPWRNLVNCFHLTPGGEYKDLLEATKCDFLHSIYLEAQATVDQYRLPRYLNEHIIPNLVHFL